VHIRLLPESYKDLIVPHKSFPFRPNMSASADIQTKTVAHVLSVPLNAVTTRDAKVVEKKDNKDNAITKDATAAKSVSTDSAMAEVVFVLQKEGTVKKVNVKTAIQDLNYIQITEGLKKDDEVITSPYNVVSKTLKEGDKVKVVAKDKLYDDTKKKE
jgi:HlyD family secretion protein